MSRPETHRIFNNRIDIGARLEAEQILVNKCADIEMEINRLMTQVKNCTKNKDNLSLQRISDVAEHIQRLTKKLELTAGKLYRLRHEKTRFAFFDVCGQPTHRNVMIAGESHREFAEDRSIIIKEVLVARKVSRGEEVNDDENRPQLRMVCAHPRSAKDIAFDLRNNHTVRGWFQSLGTPSTSSKLAQGAKNGIKKRKLDSEVENDESGVAANLKKIRIDP